MTTPAGTPNENVTPTPEGTPEGTPVVKPVAAAAGAPAGTEWIPEDLRSHKSLTKFKAPGDVAKAYVNLEGMLGKRIEIPDDNAPAEVKAAFRTKMGVPERPELYDDPALPEGREMDAALVGGFKRKAHEVGIPKAQAKALMDWYVGIEQQRVTDFEAASAKAKSEGMSVLKAKWGGAVDVNVGIVQRVVAEYGTNELKEALDRTGAGNDPAVLEFLHRIGRTLIEDNLIDPKGLSTGVDEAKSEIAKIQEEARKDKKHPLRNSSHPGHKETRAKMQRLYEIAYPNVEFAVSGV